VFVQRYAESCGEGGGVYAISTGDLCDYAHVTRLQAELANMLEIAEANSHGASALIDSLNEVQNERDTLKAELSLLRDMEKRATESLWSAQSELTKARRSAMQALSLIEPIRRGANLSSSDIWEACAALEARLPAPAKIDTCVHEWVDVHNEYVKSGEICAKLCGAIRSGNQSAPAAKGGE